MVGSFGTLAAIAQINFKVFPVPVESRTFVQEFSTAAEAFAERDRILRGALQPAAIDVVNWPSAHPLNWRLLIGVGGNAKALDRYARELPGAQLSSDAVWDEIREFTPRFLAANPAGRVAAIPSKLTDMAGWVEKLNVPVIARAGSNVVYAHFAHSTVIFDPSASGDSAMMKRVKEMFDPGHLLNRGRLYGRI
jgi:glycolate oxidase FAD binding subunit